MKSILTINTHLPSVEDRSSYLSGDSLRDYDIAVFNPAIPYQRRIDFTGGGSCLDIDSTKAVNDALKHWNTEIRSALQSGKTVFFILDEQVTDSGTVGYGMSGKTRSYNTFSISNYGASPAPLPLKNTKGRRVLVKDSLFRPLYELLKDCLSYRVIMEQAVGRPVFTTQDGAVVGSVLEYTDGKGHLVFLPYFDLTTIEPARGARSDRALQVSRGIVAQLVAIDRSLRMESVSSPQPEWCATAKKPKAVENHNAAIAEIQTKITELEASMASEVAAKEDLLSVSRLLYENGKMLEAAIEDGLRVLGYSVENYTKGDIEIDHIIQGPSKLRMIGESEGKDTSAIDITKFRQLESNINEDFERDEIEVPAKGVLFGNGFRFTEPATRAEQFTAKCLTNAKRLHTALVRTSDLHAAVIHALDNPDDEEFRAACRAAIEDADGKIVVFP